MKAGMRTSMIATALLAAAVAEAAPQRPPFRPSDAEIASLPPYCKARLKERPGDPNWEQWKAVLGKMMDHLHHYCFSLNFLNRALHARDAKARKADLVSAMNNLEYVETRSPPDFVLLPEILLNKANILRLQGKRVEAAQYFRKSIAAKPDYSPAYAGLADFFLENGDREQAVRILEEGLARVPRSRLLRRKLAALRAPSP